MEFFKIIFNLCASVFTQPFFNADFFQAGIWIFVMALPFVMVAVFLREV